MKLHMADSLGYAANIGYDSSDPNIVLPKDVSSLKDTTSRPAWIICRFSVSF